MCFCHLCHEWHKWHKFTMAIPHPKIMETLRKSESRVINKYKLEICNQISHIDNPFFVIRCQIFNYLIN